MIPKRGERIRSESHLQYVREFACLKCGAVGPSEAHHILRGETRMGNRRAGDHEVVPLCRSCHWVLHSRVGNEVKFFGAVDYRQIAANLWKERLTK